MFELTSCEVYGVNAFLTLSSITTQWLNRDEENEENKNHMIPIIPRKAIANRGNTFSLSCGKQC